jgi:CDP-glucose 4,6-dehydratase
MIRYPHAVRPWQHVLDCLSGYLLLVDALLDGRGAGEWNFGPGPESFVEVQSIADRAAGLWGEGASWVADSAAHPHEAKLLALDSQKAERELNWRDALPYPLSLEWTVDWQQRVEGGSTPEDVTRNQLDRFAALASS